MCKTVQNCAKCTMLSEKMVQNCAECTKIVKHVQNCASCANCEKIVQNCAECTKIVEHVQFVQTVTGRTLLTRLTGLILLETNTD